MLERSAGGLILPSISTTAWMLGLVPVAEQSAWLNNMVGTYVIAREYLGPAEARRGREFSREDWIAVLLTLHSQDEYLYQLAVLNHVTRHKELKAQYQERFLAQIPPDDAAALQTALTGGIDGVPRVFLVRQIVLRAMRLILVPPDLPKVSDPDVASMLADVGLEVAAVLLVHLAADALAKERTADEPRLGSTSESLSMEMVANSLFKEHDDIGDMLARYRLLWIDYGNNLTRDPARAAPVTLLREATGLNIDDIIALGFGFYAYVLAHKLENPIAVNAYASFPMEQDVINRFLDLFSISAADLSSALADCPKPWQMLPIQERPLLRRGDDIVVLDEQYLIERSHTWSVLACSRL